jgi:predicted Rossmann-fold nucleotide-binding protein
MRQGETGGYTRTTSGVFPIVGVMGSGTHPHDDRSTALGLWLATQGVHLLTGGGGGVMEAVSKAFHSVQGRSGKIIGILPGDVDESGYRPLPGYPNGAPVEEPHQHPDR